MTTPQIDYLNKKCYEITDDFFVENNQGLDWIYDTVRLIPEDLIDYRDQIGDDEYNRIKDQLKVYKAALKAVRAINNIRPVFG